MGSGRPTAWPLPSPNLHIFVFFSQGLWNTRCMNKVVTISGMYAQLHVMFIGKCFPSNNFSNCVPGQKLFQLMNKLPPVPNVQVPEFLRFFFFFTRIIMLRRSNYCPTRPPKTQITVMFTGPSKRNGTKKVCLCHTVFTFGFLVLMETVAYHFWTQDISIIELWQMAHSSVKKKNIWTLWQKGG
jgi:hypothetical protein